jgi:hypothetical protein
VVVAETTRRLVGRLFEYHDLGHLPAEGSAEPMHAWQVIGPSSIESRFEALRSEATPLVGRDEELELLLRRWRLMICSPPSTVGSPRASTPPI